QRRLDILGTRGRVRGGSLVGFGGWLLLVLLQYQRLRPPILALAFCLVTCLRQLIDAVLQRLPLAAWLRGCIARFPVCRIPGFVLRVVAVVTALCGVAGLHLLLGLLTGFRLRLLGGSGGFLLRLARGIALLVTRGDHDVLVLHGWCASWRIALHGQARETARCGALVGHEKAARRRLVWHRRR